MSENKRFTIKSQDDYFGITDNNTVDKVNVINSIHTEIEAEWLCDLLNELHEENEQLKQDVTDTNMANSILQERVEHYRKENEQLRNNIKEAYQTERTMIGKSVLKQLIEQME